VLTWPTAEPRMILCAVPVALRSSILVLALLLRLERKHKTFPLPFVTVVVTTLVILGNFHT
jgi:hypothetical protein